MNLPSMTTIAVTGMQAAATQFATSASNIANLDTAEYQRKAANNVALPTGGVEAKVSTENSGATIDEELYGMIGAKIAFEANASAFETGADLWEVLATIKRD